MSKRVVVTGIGIWGCIGKDVKEVTESLKIGRSGIGLDQDRLTYGYQSGLTGIVERPKLKGLLDRRLRVGLPEEARQRARDAGATGYLPKPADASRLDHLLSALRDRVRVAPAPQPVHQPAPAPQPVAPPPVAPVSRPSAIDDGEFGVVTPSYVAPAAVPPAPQAQIPLAVTYVDTTEITRRIDALERQLSSAQERAQRAAEEGKAGMSSEIERHRKEVQHLQHRLAESDRRATISIVIGAVALLIALVAIVWQLLPSLGL